MDFEFSPDEQAFAEEVRGFLRAHPPERFPVDGMDAGYGSGAHSRAFLSALAERGWLTMTWPRAFGGQERSLMYTLALFEELAAVGAPFGPLAGCQQTAEGIIRYGSETLRREVLPRIGRGEVTFWQGFSEPESGSDLLSLKTEAARRGVRAARPQDLEQPRGHRGLRPRARPYRRLRAPASGSQHVRGRQQLLGPRHPADPEPHR